MPSTTRCVALGVALLLGAPTGAPAQYVTVNDNIKEVEAWVREDTNDAQRQYALALSHWKHRHWQQTDSLLRLAVRLDPRYAEGYLALYYLPFARRPSLADEQLKDRVPDAWKAPLKEAESFYQRAFRTDPMVNLQVMGIAFDIEEPKPGDFTTSDYIMYRRYYAWFVELGTGRYRDAYEHLQALSQRDFNEAKDPDKVPDYILWYRGVAAAHTLKVEAAITDFRRLLDRAVKKTQRDEIVHVPLRDNEYRFMLASLQNMAGHADSAIALYQESLEHDLGLVMAHTYLANIYEESGRTKEAIVERQRATEVSGDDAAAFFELAATLFNAGQVVETDKPLRQAIALNPRFAPSYYLLGRADEELGLPDEARKDFKTFLALAPLRLANLRTDAQQRLDKLPK